MAQVGLDLFDFAGKKHLICVDKWSGFPVFKRLQTQTTKAITDILAGWFNLLGWPSSVRTDGGPQFCGPFREWCQAHNITQELASPYNPKANGLAESAVKNVKLVLSKCAETGQDPIELFMNGGIFPARMASVRPNFFSAGGSIPMSLPCRHILLSTMCRRQLPPVTRHML